MKIIKFYQFIKEELNDTPENYIEVGLSQLKRKIDKIFEYQEGDIDDIDDTEEKSLKKARRDSKKKDKMSFKDLGVNLQSSEVSKYSKLYDNYFYTTLVGNDYSIIYKFYLFKWQ